MLYKYYPPFLKDISDFLNIKKDGIYVDCTFGCGKHSLQILKNLNSYGRLYSFDCDINSINLGKKIINDNRFTLIHDNFNNIKYHLCNLNLKNNINGIIYDLGMSSIQLDDFKRGFSFLRNGPLDMRMNQNIGYPLKYWINKISKKNIYKILRKYSEDYLYKKIANKIIYFREFKKFNTTFDLSNIIDKVTKKYKNYKTKARIFQAFRIFINNELDFLKNSLYLSYKLLCHKGRLVVISFNSLEDRIVKEFIKIKSNINYRIINDIPLTFKEIKKINNIRMNNLGKFKPSEKEILINPRIRSALLRVAEKI